MPRSRFQRALAVALILIVTPVVVATPALSAGSAQFGGRVFQADGVTPRTGVVVALVDAETQQTYRAEPTNAEGAFALAAAPAGTYNLLAETDEGAFLASEAIRLEAGANRALALSLDPSRSYNGQSTPSSAGGSSGSGMPNWAKGLIAGAIGVVALVVINEAGKDVEEPASTF